MERGLTLRTNMTFNVNQTIDEKRLALIEMLSKGVCQVEFTKVNGERRVMPCTLTSNLLPPSLMRENTEKKERKVNTDVLRVFVTDINDWRSFRIDSVISIT